MGNAERACLPVDAPRSSPFQVRDDSYVLQRMVKAAQAMQMQVTQQKQQSLSQQQLPPHQQTPQSAQHQHTHGAGHQQQQQQHQSHPSSQALPASHVGHMLLQQQQQQQHSMQQHLQQQQHHSSQQHMASGRGAGNGSNHDRECGFIIPMSWFSKLTPSVTVQCYRLSHKGLTTRFKVASSAGVVCDVCSTSCKACASRRLALASLSRCCSV